MRIRKSRRAAENRLFLADLARTGNARLTAARLGVHRGTYLKRRARDPVFAAAWDRALATADAALDLAEAARLAPPGAPPDRPLPDRPSPGQPSPARRQRARRQLRMPAAGAHRITAQDEAWFLEIVDETNNIRLAAEALGFAHSSFLARARRSPRFARELAIRCRIASDRLVAQRYIDARHLTFPPGTKLDDPTDMGWRQIVAQLTHHDSHGRLQRHHARRRLPHEDLEGARRAIMALAREAYFRETGRWRYEDE